MMQAVFDAHYINPRASFRQTQSRIRATESLITSQIFWITLLLTYYSTLMLSVYVVLKTGRLSFFELTKTKYSIAEAFQIN